MSDTSQLARSLAAVRRWWWVVVLLTLLGAALGWMALPEQPSVETEQVEVVDPAVEYRATHILLRARSTPETANLDIVTLLAREGEIPSLAAEKLGRSGDAGTLVGEVQLSVDKSLGTLSVATTQPTEEEAVRVVDTYAEAIVEHFDARSAQAQDAQIERSIQRLADIDQRIRQLEDDIAGLPEGSVEARLAESELDVLINQYGSLQASVRDQNIQQIDQPPTFTTLQEPVPLSTVAQAPEPVFQPPTDPVLRVALGAALGLLLGIALALVIDRLDTRIRTRQDAEAAFGLPVLAGIPKRRWRLRDHLPWSGGKGADGTTVVGTFGTEVTEAYRALGISLRLSPRWQLSRHAPTSNGTVGTATQLPPGADAMRTVLVTSPGVGDGKSVTVANLAAAFAETGVRVLVVDCDFRRPAMHRLLGGQASPGLRSLDPHDVDFTRAVRHTAVRGVSLVPAGTAGPAPSALLLRPEALLAAALEHADVVVVDTGPLLMTNEASSLIPEADAVLVVGRKGRTTKRNARMTTQRLSGLGARAAGIALVGVADEGGYGHGHGYGYGEAPPVPVRSAAGEVGNRASRRSAAKTATRRFRRGTPATRSGRSDDSGAAAAPSSPAAVPNGSERSPTSGSERSSATDAKRPLTDGPLFQPAAPAPPPPPSPSGARAGSSAGSIGTSTSRSSPPSAPEMPPPRRQDAQGVGRRSKT